MSDTIETERLYLRPLTEADASQAYADWMNDPAVNKYLETRHLHQTIDTCRDFIRQCNQDRSSHLFGIFVKGSDQHIGNAKLGFVNTRYGRAELSMVIGNKSFWGKGLGTELVHAMTKFGFDQLGLQRIQAGCYQEHHASLRTFQKLGYSVEGLFRNHVIFDGRPSGCYWLAILKHEFS